MKDLRLGDIMTELDLIEQHANLSGKVVVHLRADGPKNHPDKAAEVWEFYDGKMDDNLRHALMQYGEVYCYFETVEYAMNCVEDWFPRSWWLENQEYPLNEEYYIYAYGMGPNNQAVLHN